MGYTISKHGKGRKENHERKWPGLLYDYISLGVNPRHWTSKQEKSLQTDISHDILKQAM